MKTKLKIKRIDKASERRRAPRRQPAMGTVCRFADDAAIHGMGLVWNISTTGVSVLSSEPCAAGVRLEGELKTLDDRSKLPISFDVTHVKELETGDYVLAGPFPRSLSAAKIKPFIATQAKR